YTYDPITGAGTVEYTYTLLDSEDHTDDGNDTLDDIIPVQLIDNDDDPVDSNIVVRIIDDVPSAEDDVVTIDDGEAKGNVITGTIEPGSGTGTPSAPDVAGADGGLTVTDISSDNVSGN